MKRSARTFIAAALLALAAGPAFAAEPAPIPADTSADIDPALAASEQALYNAARNNTQALDLYIQTCRVCAFKAAAADEIRKLNEPAKPAALPEQKWISFAFGLWRDRRGRGQAGYGYSGVKTSAADAESAAMAFCRRDGIQNCKTLATYSDGCHYITVGRSRKSARISQRDSIAETLQVCRQGGYTCNQPIGACLEAVTPQAIAAASTPARAETPPGVNVRNELASAMRRCFSNTLPDDEKVAGCRAVASMEPQASHVQGVPVEQVMKSIHDARMHVLEIFNGKKDYASFVAAADEFAHQKPGDIEMIEWRGIGHLNQKEWQLAAADFSEAIALDGKCYDCYSGRGVAYLGANDFDKAMSDIDVALHDRPENTGYLLTRARIYRKMEKFELTLKDLDAASKLAPDNTDFVAEKIETYRAMKDFDAALKEANAAIQRAPKEPVYVFSRAYIYKDMTQYDLAIKDVDRTVALMGAPTPDVSKFRSEILKLQGEQRGQPGQTCVNWDDQQITLDQRIDDCTTAIQSGRDLHQAYFNRGAAYYRKGLFERAIQDENEALKLDPDAPMAYFNRGASRHSLGQYDDAIRDYSEAIKLDPKYIRALTERGVAYGQRGDTGRALSDLDKVIALNPRYVYAHIERGIVNLYAGALPEALADFGRAKEADPTNLYIMLWIDIVNKRSRLPSRLAKMSEGVDTTKWPGPIVRLYLGRLNADAAYAAAENKDPKVKSEQTCEVNFYYGELLLQRSHKDEAIRSFRSAAADCPKLFFEFNAALAELKALGESP